jgi:hypothetical protein
LVQLVDVELDSLKRRPLNRDGFWILPDDSKETTSWIFRRRIAISSRSAWPGLSQP